MSLKNLKIFKKHQSRLFLLFFAAASFVWLINSLNEVYVRDISFRVKYINLDKDLNIDKETPQKISLRLSASGFKLLSLGFGEQTLNLDLMALAENSKGNLFLSESNQLSQFSSQLGASVTISGFSTNVPIELKFYKLQKKKVPIVFKDIINVSSNRFIDFVKLSPDSVWLRGSEKQLSSLKHINSQSLNSKPLGASIDTLLGFTDIDVFSVEPSKFRLNVSVLEFSERSFLCEIMVKDTPENYDIHLFPEKLEVIVAAPIEALKSISSKDFEIYVSFKELLGLQSNIILPSLASKNSNIHSLHLKESKGVEFILTKEE